MSGFSALDTVWWSNNQDQAGLTSTTGCNSSVCSPLASRATATEANGRLAICWRSLISCWNTKHRWRTSKTSNAVQLRGIIINRELKHTVLQYRLFMCSVMNIRKQEENVICNYSSDRRNCNFHTTDQHIIGKVWEILPKLQLRRRLCG